MNNWVRRSIFLAALLFPACAAAAPNDMSPAMQTFVQSYIKALREHDPAQLRALTDPQSVACIESLTPVWFDQEAHSYKDLPGTPEITVSDFPSVTMPPGVSFPDTPQKLLVMRWNSESGMQHQDILMQLSLIETGNSVFQVLPCPTIETIRMRNEFFLRQGYKAPQ